MSELKRKEMGMDIRDRRNTPDPADTFIAAAVFDPSL